MFGVSGTRYSQTVTGHKSTAVRSNGRTSKRFRASGNIARTAKTRTPPPAEKMSHFVLKRYRVPLRRMLREQVIGNKMSSEFLFRTSGRQFGHGKVFVGTCRRPRQHDADRLMRPQG